MELSIFNFKSIRKLLDFEIKSFNIISGVNSSGKSSFIQLLLLIKQTILLNSASIQLDVSGSLYQALDFRDVLFKKQYENKLKFSLVFNKAEFSKISNREVTLLLDSLDDYKCRIEIEFDFQNDAIFISEFSIHLPELAGKVNYIKVLASGDQTFKFVIEANNEIFAKFDYLNPPPILDVRYSSIYPVDFEYPVVSITDDGLPDTKRQFVGLKIDEFKSIVDTFFNNISYIGPLREPPRDEYSIARKNHSVGPKGEVTAQIFENQKDRIISHYKLVLCYVSFWKLVLHNDELTSL